MPAATPYALLRVSLNGGAAQTGGIVAAFEDTVNLDAESTVGWGSPAARWEITDYPDGWATPAGWSLDATTGAIYYTASNITGTTPPSFDLPTAASNMWGKWKFRLLVNGGGGTLTDWASGVEIVSPAGIHDLAAAESTEYGGVRSWVGPHKDNLRSLSTAIESGVGGGASLGAGTPHTISMAAGNDGALLTAAPFDHSHQALVGTPVAIGEANSTGAGPELAAKNHVHDHGNLTGGARHAVAVANVSHGFLSATDKAKLDGIAAGAGVVNFTNVNAALATANATIDVNGQKITNGAAPTAASDFVIKSYVDGLLFGLDLKASVRGASLGNQTLSGALTEDGVTYVTGDRYLAKNQSTASQNGLYVVDTAGPWSRTTDANTSAKVTPGLYVYVEEGTALAKTGWALTTAAPIVLDTTNLVFTQVYGPGAITAGAGLTQTGTTVDVVANADGSIVVNANDIQVGVITDAQHGSRGNGTLHTVADASHNGFMPMGHWTLVDGATATPTASKIMKWGASVDAGAAYFYDANYSGSLAASGWLRLGVGATTVLAGRAASGSTTRSLIRWSAAKLFVGDEADETQIDAGTAAHIGVSGSKSIYVTSSGIQIFGGGTVDFGSGVGVIGLNVAGTEPTANPASGKIIVYLYGGALKTRGPKGLVSSLARDADAEQALQVNDLWWRTAQTTDVAAGANVYPDTLPVNSSFALELNLIGVQHGTDARCHFKIISSGGRAAGAMAVDVADVQTLFDAIGVPAPTVSNNANRPQLNCLGKAATVIDWTSFGTIRIVAPTP